MTKAQIRRDMLEKRLSMEPQVVAKKSAKLIHTIVKQRWFKDAKTIAIYHPIKNEVDLLGLLEHKDKIFCLPKVIKNKLQFIEFNEQTQLVLSDLKILEPAEGAVLDDSIDVMFVPSLAIDKNRNRVGFGKGFYDEYLHRKRPKWVVGVIYDFQEYNRIKRDENDFTIDLYFKG